MTRFWRATVTIPGGADDQEGQAHDGSDDEIALPASRLAGQLDHGIEVALLSFGQPACRPLREAARFSASLLRHKRSSARPLDSHSPRRRAQLAEEHRVFLFSPSQRCNVASAR